MTAAILQEFSYKAIIAASTDEEHPVLKDSKAALIIYYAETGESLWNIARQYYTSVNAIKEENDLSDDNVVSKVCCSYPCKRTSKNPFSIKWVLSNTFDGKWGYKMGNSIYQDIAERTKGSVYIGVIGPVRTGKSTFIKRFMDTIVIPNMDGDFEKNVPLMKCRSQLQAEPLMTTEP